MPLKGCASHEIKDYSRPFAKQEIVTVFFDNKVNLVILFLIISNLHPSQSRVEACE